MIQSMTGFGSAEQDGFRVDIRSLNHRYLDISIKCPAFLSEHEMTFRSVLRKSFARGKFDVAITVAHETGSGLHVDTDAAARILQSLRTLKQDFSIPGEVDIRTVAGFHDLFVGPDVHYDPEKLHAVFAMAVDRIRAMRETEGAALDRELRQLADALAAMNRKVRELSSAMVPDIARRLRERLDAVLEGREINEDRIVQEAALLAVKLDIAEEISRIDSHLVQFRETLSAGGVAGRKLDFLTQELNREANTIGSKAGDFGIISETVEMKSCIERIKEQVQNVQ